MSHELHYPILKDLGLTETEAVIYEVLLEQGPKPAKDLVIPSGLSRGNVYNGLTALIKRGLATEKSGAKTIYEAAPPSTLEVLVEKDLSRLHQLDSSLESVVPLMAKEYAFTTGKPVIQVFEGIEGAEKAIMQTLEGNHEVMAYIDNSSMTPEFEKLNARYIKERIKRGISKRFIVEDTPGSRTIFAHEDTPETQVKFVRDFPHGFKTTMQIFGDNVLLLTLDQVMPIALIIRDSNIANMHRAHFQFVWDHAAVDKEETFGSQAKKRASGS